MHYKINQITGRVNFVSSFGGFIHYKVISGLTVIYDKFGDKNEKKTGITKKR